jgi:hypothetical protein
MMMTITRKKVLMHPKLMRLSPGWRCGCCGGGGAWAYAGSWMRTSENEHYRHRPRH